MPGKKQAAAVAAKTMFSLRCSSPLFSPPLLVGMRALGMLPQPGAPVPSRLNPDSRLMHSICGMAAPLAHCSRNVTRGHSRAGGGGTSQAARTREERRRAQRGRASGREQGGQGSQAPGHENVRGALLHLQGEQQPRGNMAANGSSSPEATRRTERLGTAG